jgi:Xaa-Pro aminopeptidase
MGGVGDLARILAERRTDMATIDVGRMGRERHARLQAEMARRGVDAALLLHGANVTYAAGSPGMAGADVSHAVFERPVAVVVAGEGRPHLLGGDADPGLDVEHHPPAWPELDEGAEGLAGAVAEIVGPLAGRRLAVDEQTGAMLRTGVLRGADIADASHIIGAAKLRKTDDELACIEEAQRRNEEAMATVQDKARVGATRSEVAGAFLERLVELRVQANLIDPIFQPMPRAMAAGPRTTPRTIAFPTGVDDPTFGEGDIVWVDSGIDHLGYASDFGRTWVIGRDPNVAERRLFERWSEVMVAVLDVLKPGVTGGDLCRAAADANGGARPWLPHFYLAHGVGVESAEMPLVGTDLGPDFDDRLVMAPGMVLVLEPVIWDDGVGGYRAEEIVAVTQDGWRHLGGGHGYPPFA